MSLKAGYVGVLRKDAEKLEKVPGIESIGDGLSLEDGELAATGGGGSSASIAPTFDSTAAYTIGDYVYYEGTLYRFTSNHAAGDWNSEEVTAATIGADLEENTAEIAKAYKSDDTAEVTLDDADYFPFYDSSASAKRKTLWSNIKAVLSNIFTLLSVIGTVENGTNPTRSYTVGEHFIRNGKLGTCISPVTTSGTWTLNTNYVEGSILSLFSTYNYNEHLTGEYWIDGKPIYQKTIFFDTPPNNSSVYKDLGFYLDQVVSADFYSCSTGGTGYRTGATTFYERTTSTQIAIYTDRNTSTERKNKAEWRDTADFTGYLGFLTIKYTKV